MGAWVGRLHDLGGVRICALAAVAGTSAVLLSLGATGRLGVLSSSVTLSLPWWLTTGLPIGGTALLLGRRTRRGVHSGTGRGSDVGTELDRALARQEFLLHYQPIVELAGGRVVGAEALVRWDHPDSGLLAPAAFVPVAERTGQILPIGRWVLREAAGQAAEWLRRMPPQTPFTMSVNVSARQLQDPRFVGHVRDALLAVGLPAERLVLEITESVLVQDADRASAHLAQLKELGIRVAIDDFGTGYSSLSYLNRFPIDILKVDKAFVAHVGVPEQGVLTRAIVGLGQTLGLETVAEGIETLEQLNHLQALGCRLGQGFLFHRPLEAAQVGRLLQAETTSPTATLRATDEFWVDAVV